MTASLSLYSSKIIKEHPLGLWPLQDKCDYLSILNSSQRDLTSWSLDGGQMSYTSTLTTPIPEEPVYRIDSAHVGASNVRMVRLNSEVIGNFSSINEYLATFTLSTFLYSSTDSILSATIGFAYTDPTYGEYRVFKRFPLSVAGKWVFLSETFDRPYDINSEYYLFIEIEFLSNKTTDPVLFLLNGLSLGQWTEEFNSSSSGVVPETVVGSIYGLPDNSKAVKLLASAEATKDGYAIVADNQLKARNSGMPMVYGSDSSMTIYPNGSSPSIVIPGLGFMNRVGQYKNYTIEAWIKISPSGYSESKIFGPVASSDGIYVDGPFLKLKVGDYSISHYVSEWYRPMLVHISISSDRIVMLLNGEQVGQILVNRSDLVFPEEVLNGKEQDWLGFYSNDSIDIFEIGPVSIYTYVISNAIAKRRWIFGQGVDNPETLNVAYGGKNIYFDYQFAKYSSNYSYPKIGSWSSGISNNLSSDTDYLKIPSFKSMELVVPEQTQSEFLKNSKSIQNEDSKFISLPNNAYGYFENINILKDGVESIYVTFKSISAPTELRQTLIELRDKTTGDYLSVSLSGSGIEYKLKYLGQTEVLGTTQQYYPGEKFSIGLHIKRFASYFGNAAATFLSKKDSLALYVGGTGSSDSFIGNIYSISFNNQFATKKIEDYFAPNGIVWDAELVESMLADADAGLYSTTFWEFVLDGGQVAEYAGIGLIDNANTSYTIKPYENSSTMYLDGVMNGSWKSALPLSYFGKNVTNSKGIQYYDLDFIQFNIGYPSPGRSIAVTETDASWSYQDLALKFSSPSQKKYSDLDNHLYTGYIDYTDLKNNSRQTYKLDTSGSIVKSYIYFKDISQDVEDDSYYTNISMAPKDGMLSPGEEWINTKYEIVDGMIIYPPTNVSFAQTVMVTEIAVSAEHISDKPLAISTLELSSIALNDETPTPIGTRYGTDIYPFTENGFYYDYKSPNPFSIYKGSTPYLYLTKNSGIRLKGAFNNKNVRGIDIPVNSEKTNNHKMIAMQMFAMYDDDFFPYSPTEIFEIISNTSHLKFYIEATHPDGLRGKIYAINDKTGQLENGVGYYINGKVVKDPVLTIKQWASLGIGFSNYLDFSNNGGSIRITGPMLINNISHYNSVRLQQVQNISVRPWFLVKESGRVKFDWRYWDGIFKWFEVLVLSSRNFYGIDPSDIYKSYVGTTRIIIDDKSILRLLRSKYRAITNSNRQTTTINAV
jgi:hypothetical protein